MSLDVISNELTCNLNYRHVFKHFLSSIANGSTEGWNKQLTMKVLQSNYAKSYVVSIILKHFLCLCQIENIVSYYAYIMLFSVSFVNIMFLKNT